MTVELIGLGIMVMSFILLAIGFIVATMTNKKLRNKIERQIAVIDEQEDIIERLEGDAKQMFRKRLDYKLLPETKTLIDNLINVEGFTTAGILFLDNSVINALVCVNRQCWIQTDYEGRIQQVYVSVDENTPDKLICAVTGEIKSENYNEAKQLLDSALTDMRKYSAKQNDYTLEGMASLIATAINKLRQYETNV